jgi:hypothetical protein
MYLFVLILSTLLLSFDPINGTSFAIQTDLGTDIGTHGFLTNFSASLSCISNIGPAFEAVGPYSSFASYNDFSTIVLMLVMLLTMASCGENTTSSTDTSKDAASSADLEGAKAFLKNMYLDAATSTAGDYTRTNVVMVAGVSYKIEWSVEVADGAVSIEKGETEDTIDFDADDFAKAYNDATGKTFKSFAVPKLPSTTYGVLYYDYDGKDEEKIVKGEGQVCE